MVGPLFVFTILVTESQREGMHANERVTGYLHAAPPHVVSPSTKYARASLPPPPATWLFGPTWPPWEVSRANGMGYTRGICAGNAFPKHAADSYSASPLAPMTPPG